MFKDIQVSGLLIRTSLISIEDFSNSAAFLSINITDNAMVPQEPQCILVKVLGEKGGASLLMENIVVRNLEHSLEKPVQQSSVMYLTGKDIHIRNMEPRLN